MPYEIQTIGGDFEFRKITNLPDGPGMKLKKISRPGVGGYAFKELGFQGETTIHTGVAYCDGLAAVNAYEAAIKAAQGTQVQLVTPHVKTYPFMVLERVRTLRVKKVLGVIWNASGIYLDPYRLTLQLTMTYPYDD